MTIDTRDDFEFPEAETKHDRKMLVRALEMLGSDNAGERDAAAHQCERIRKKHGLTWKFICRPW
jgi:hypothetical protein